MDPLDAPNTAEVTQMRCFVENKGAPEISDPFRKPVECSKMPTTLGPHLLAVLLRALGQRAVGGQVLQLLRRQVERVRAPAAGAADRPRVLLLLLLLLPTLRGPVAACKLGKDGSRPVGQEAYIMMPHAVCTASGCRRCLCMRGCAPAALQSQPLTTAGPAALSSTPAAEKASCDNWCGVQRVTSTWCRARGARSAAAAAAGCPGSRAAVGAQPAVLLRGGLLLLLEAGARRRAEAAAGGRRAPRLLRGGRGRDGPAVGGGAGARAAGRSRAAERLVGRMVGRARPCAEWRRRRLLLEARWAARLHVW
jgi:hypothetical protein